MTSTCTSLGQTVHMTCLEKRGCGHDHHPFQRLRHSGNWAVRGLFPRLDQVRLALRNPQRSSVEQTAPIPLAGSQELSTLAGQCVNKKWSQHAPTHCHTGATCNACLGWGRCAAKPTAWWVQWPGWAGRWTRSCGTCWAQPSHLLSRVTSKSVQLRQSCRPALRGREPLASRCGGSCAALPLGYLSSSVDKT